MGAAAIMSLAEVRERKQRAEFRRQLHERVDHWCDALEEKVTEPKPTFEHLTWAVWELRQELTGSVTEALLEHRWRAEQERTIAPCPRCGRAGAARGVVSRTLETLVGEVELARPYFYCVPCGSNSRSRTWRWEASRSGDTGAVRRGTKGHGARSRL